MSILDMIVYGWRALASGGNRSVWVIIGLTLGTALFIAISGLSAGYTRLVALPFSELATDCIIQRSVKGGEQANGAKTGVRLPFADQPISGAEQERIQALAEVEHIDRVVMLWYQSEKSFSVIAGVEPDATIGPAKVMTWITKGRKIEAPGEAVVEGHYAKFNGLKVGDTVVFDRLSLTIVGVATLREGATVAAANYYISLDDARRLGGLDGNAANMLFLRLKKGVDPAGLQERLPQILSGGVVSTTDSIGGMMKGFAGISNMVSRLMGWVVLAFSIFLSCWLIAGSINERSSHIGLMKTVGWCKRDILAIFGAETALLGTIGALCGIGLGYAIVLGVSHSEVSLTLPWNLSPTPGIPGHHQSGAATMSLPVVLQAATCLAALGTAVGSAVLTGILIAGHIADMKVRRAFDWS
jgi:ABC-type antimicrobial peptide transport system permease subunit